MEETEVGQEFCVCRISALQAFEFQLFDRLAAKSRRAMTKLFSLLFFVLAGLCEIGGGYLVWLWMREGKSVGLALGGVALLTVYGFVATRRW